MTDFCTKSLQKYVTLKGKLKKFTSFIYATINVKTTASFLIFIFVNIQEKACRPMRKKLCL